MRPGRDLVCRCVGGVVPTARLGRGLVTHARPPGLPEQGGFASAGDGHVETEQHRPQGQREPGRIDLKRANLHDAQYIALDRPIGSVSRFIRGLAVAVGR